MMGGKKMKIKISKDEIRDYVDCLYNEETGYCELFVSDVVVNLDFEYFVEKYLDDIIAYIINHHRDRLEKMLKMADEGKRAVEIVKEG